MVNAEDSDVFSYTREYEGEKILVIGSFSDKKISFEIPSKLNIENAEKIIGNYNEEVTSKENTLYLRPYEAVAYLIK